MQRVLIIVLVLSTVLAACNRGAEDTTSTTTTTTLDPVTGTTTPTTVADAAEDPDEAADDGGVVDDAPTALPAYSIVRREGAEGGDRLVVLLEEGEYNDIVLENLVGEITELYAPVLEAYFIDSDDAADLVLLDPEGLTDADDAVLEDHLLVTVTEGSLVTFRGPFAEMGEYRLGS